MPDAVQEASSAAVAAIWLQAQELANESLHNAQAAWEVERGELDAMRQELAEAFERPAIELDTAVAALAAEKAAAGKQALELAAVVSSWLTPPAGQTRQAPASLKSSTAPRICAPSWTVRTPMPTACAKRPARPANRPPPRS